MNNRIATPFSKVLSGLTASGTTEITSSALDFANGDRAVITVVWGTMAGAQTIEVDGSQDNSSWTSLKATSGGSALSIAVTTGSASKMTRLEFAVANYRYLRIRIPRANAAQVLAVLSDQYDDRVEPVPAADHDVKVRYIHPFAPVFLPNLSPADLSL